MTPQVVGSQNRRSVGRILVSGGSVPTGLPRIALVISFLGTTLWQSQMDRAKIEADFVAAAQFIKGHKKSSSKLGVVGFCFGGYIVNMLAAVIPDELNVGVPFYGTPAAKELRQNIKGPLMVQLAELDKRVNASWPEYEEDLKTAEVDYAMHMYAQANHGFHNDSTGRYDEKNANLAWKRTLIFLKNHLFQS